MKKYFFLLFSIVSFNFANAENFAKDSIIIKKIWDHGKHQAFTDLIRFKGSFYCSFREGENHVSSGSNGKVRIIRSVDGNIWESVALLEVDGIDLRDPKLSVTPDVRLMVTVAGAVFSDGIPVILHPMTALSDKMGKNFGHPVSVVVDPSIKPKYDWIWRVTWHKGIGYGINYQLTKNAKKEDRNTLPKDAWNLYLMKTTDGINFQNVRRLEVEGLPNESTIRFDKKGKMYVLIRREAGEKHGVLAVSDAPYTDWDYRTLPYRLGGPNFIFLDKERLLIGTRIYDEGPSTGIYTTDIKGNVQNTLKLPSGGDTSYPGMLIFQGKLWVTYYSSHEGKTSIYLATIPIKRF